MSYWVSLESQEEVKVPTHSEGGTYVVDGTDEASLNITYNYSIQYIKHGFNLTDLHGKLAEKCITVLTVLVKTLGTERSDNYWEGSPGNAGYALEILLSWAKMNPKAVFNVN